MNEILINALANRIKAEKDKENGMTTEQIPQMYRDKVQELLNK